MARCPKCKGAGGNALFTSVEECATCGGSGRVADDPPASETKTPEPGGGGDVVLRGGDGSGPGGHIVLRGGNLNGSSSTDSVTLTFSDASTSTLTFTGAGNDHTVTNAATTDTTLWVGTAEAPGRLLLRGAKSEAAIVVGEKHPSGFPDLPRGSMYIRDDGTGGSLWFKAEDGADGWQPISAEGDTPAPSKPRDRGLVDWTVARVTELLPEKGKRPDWLCGNAFPILGPVAPNSLADMMALVEQEGHEAHAFVMSARDFADVCKWPDMDKVRWEGRRVWVFGVEILSSWEIPIGTVMCVSRSGHASMANLIR